MFHEELTSDSSEKLLKKYLRVMGRPERVVRRNSAVRSRHKSRHKRDPIVSFSLFLSFSPSLSLPRCVSFLRWPGENRIPFCLDESIPAFGIQSAALDISK